MIGERNMPLRERFVRRFVQLQVGLVLYGLGMALMIQARLGLDPWDVFHQGVARRLGWSIGTVVIVTGVLVLLLWIPLRQVPGVGTVSNALVIGVAVDGFVAVLPSPSGLWWRAMLLVVGILVNALATGLYIGAGLGPGPRDGLMTGYVARHPQRSVRLVRTVIEVAVLVAGTLLGGSFGVGTVLYAVGIGPLVQILLPLCRVRPLPTVLVPASTVGVDGLTG